jgi:enoyl-CoA hydratase/carnithine racemase
VPTEEATTVSDRVSVTIEDGIADVRLNRPDKLNAIDLAMFRALAETGDALHDDKALRAVVLSGEGRSFCAGLDLSAMSAMADPKASPSDMADPKASTDDPGSTAGTLGGRLPGKITNLAQQAVYTWTEMPVPVIAAVCGHAFGGGFQLALGADIRFVHPDASLSVMEVRWGIVPDMTGIPMLVRLVGLDVAKELTFTAKRITGVQAFELGLATHLSEDPRADAFALAREIAGRNPDAIRAAKALLEAAPGRPRAEAFLEESRLMGELIGSPNQVEAVTAELEGRAPSFGDASL